MHGAKINEMKILLYAAAVARSCTSVWDSLFRKILNIFTATVFKISPRTPNSFRLKKIWTKLAT
jgi:hypothetical protein